MPWSNSAREAALAARRNKTSEGKVVTKPVPKKEAKPKPTASAKPKADKEELVIKEEITEIVLHPDLEIGGQDEDIDLDALLGPDK